MLPMIKTWLFATCSCRVLASARTPLHSYSSKPPFRSTLVRCTLHAFFTRRILRIPFEPPRTTLSQKCLSSSIQSSGPYSSRYTRPFCILTEHVQLLLTYYLLCIDILPPLSSLKPLTGLLSHTFHFCALSLLHIQLSLPSLGHCNDPLLPFLQ